MSIGVFPARKGDDGEWRFIAIEIGTADRWRIIFGTPPDKDGLKEPKFQVFLRESGLSDSQIEEAIRGSIAAVERDSRPSPA
jgi:hypothetical protein